MLPRLALFAGLLEDSPSSPPSFSAALFPRRKDRVGVVVAAVVASSSPSRSSSPSPSSSAAFSTHSPHSHFPPLGARASPAHLTCVAALQEEESFSPAQESRAPLPLAPAPPRHSPQARSAAAPPPPPAFSAEDIVGDGPQQGGTGAGAPRKR